MIKQYFSICIPTALNVIYVKNTTYNYIGMLIYNDDIKIGFIIKSDYTYFDEQSYILNIAASKSDIQNIKGISTAFKLTETFFQIKIKFKGKGFKIKIYKKSKLVRLYFGKSHITSVKIAKAQLIRINKYKFIIKNLNYTNLRESAKTITHIRPLNIFTQRGLRLSRQIVLKRKKTKKTSYI